MFRPGASFLLRVLACLCLAGCGQSASSPAGHTIPRARPASANPLAVWTAVKHVRGVVDLSAPRPGDAIVVAAAGRLQTLSGGEQLRPFAPAYAAPPGLEPYIVLSSGQRVAGAHRRSPPAPSTPCGSATVTE